MTPDEFLDDVGLAIDMQKEWAMNMRNFINQGEESFGSQRRELEEYMRLNYLELPDDEVEFMEERGNFVPTTVE